MAEETAKSIRPLNAQNSAVNALSFMIESAVKGLVNTAMPVRVDAVEAGGVGPVGYVSVTPLVAQRDADNNALTPTTIHHVPYQRCQGGVCALIIDPVPGDIGIAVFAKRDISTLSTGADAPVQPGSFRSFDEADAMYIGGILNSEPEVWMEMTQEGHVTVHAPKTITLQAAEKIVMDTPLVEVEGRYVQTGGRGEGTVMTGGLTNIGGVIQSNNVTLEGHTHPGDSGGTTGEPNRGT